MAFTEEFNLLLKARYPILYISSLEEDRIEYTIRKCVKKLGNKAIYTWDFVDGYINNPNNKGFAAKNPLQALELVEKLTGDTPALFILKDFDKFLTDVSVSRKLKNLIRILKTQPKTLVILATEVNIPVELYDLITFVEFKLPTDIEIRNELKRLFTSLGQTVEPDFLEILVRSCQGLSIERIRRALSKSIAKYSTINDRTLELVLVEKQQLISQTQILEFQSTSVTFDDVGGLKNLKEWLANRKESFGEKAKLYGLPVPRGLLIAGVQGTGKSLTAKAIANDWKLPLLRLDIGRLFGGIVGESESRVRQMIQISEALAPCILWIDEIDKTFGQINSKGDSGTTSRVLGTFITWLSEKTAPVFVVSTANNFDVLPVELIRKGRFDEIFFIGLPLEDERKLIFTVHLSKLRPDSWKDFNIDILSQESKNFSGAEIQQSIIEGMHIAFNENREFTTNDIRRGLQETIPIAKMNFEEIESLQNWALSGRFRIASTL